MSEHTKENCETPEECALVDAHADDPRLYSGSARQKRVELEPARVLGVGTSAVAKVLADIVDDEHEQLAEVVDLPTRQQRRAAERAALKEQQSLVHITKEQFEKLHRARIMLAALVRREGRVRIAKRELELQRGDKLDVKVQDNGDLMVTFKAG